MTDEQRRLAKHALGFGAAAAPGFRNHYCASPGTEADREWDEMTRRGMAVLVRVPHEGLPYNTYAVDHEVACALIAGDL